MEKCEILKAYGKDYMVMTKRLLSRGGLLSELENRCGTLQKDKKTLRIALKPNLITCTPAEYGATTHPEIVEGIISYLQENGYENITIMEGSWVGDKTADAFEYCGYNALSRKYKVPIVDTQKDSSFKTDAAGMELKLCSCVKDVDFLINCPVLKGHCQTKITCALKNMKGLIPNSEKRRFHVMGLHKPIAHLNAAIHQDFIVIDHICGDPDFEEGGNPLVRDCVMVSKDPVLTDAYVADILGYQPEEIGYVKIANRLGLGEIDLNTLKVITIEGENSEDLPETRKVLAVSYAVDAVDSCSACYGMLIGALSRLKEEGLLGGLQDKIAIGQGYRGQTGKLGVGACTRQFEHSIPGCPPEEETIYSYLKDYILSEEGKK